MARRGLISTDALAARLEARYNPLMTTRGIITMVVVLLFVWGGFALFVATAVRRERRKAAERDPTARNWRD